MRVHRSHLVAFVAILPVVLSTACIQVPRGRGTFEQNLTVAGPLNLDLENGSGDVQVSAGPAGQVRVRGEFEIFAPPWVNASRIIEEIEKSPPIEQQGDLIRIGRERERRRNYRVHYTIVVPADTEIRATTGSGDLTVRGVKGPVRLSTGSGNIVTEQIGGDVEARAGSGDIHIRDVDGEADANTGSGDVQMEAIARDIRIGTGSGEIRVERPGRNVRATTGSGDVDVRGASSDLMIKTASGSLTAEGNPAARAFWELRTTSGDVRIIVPSDASFTFVAHTREDNVETSIPMEITERGRREVRGRVGKGDARIVVETSSGSVILR
jgi:DUF4097 and DUF4098 domain-containing protein YvlB